jgi:RNA polymerase sigma-54 factor
MKQSLQLRLGQHLTMTPQLQQAIRLLQLSTLELQTEVQQALESNPLLDLAEEGEPESPAAFEQEMQSSLQMVEDLLQAAEHSEAQEYLSTEITGGILDNMSTTSSTGADNTDLSNGDMREAEVGMQLSEIPDDLPVDSSWDEIYDSLPQTSSGDPDAREYETQGESPEALYDHLTWQMRMTPFSETDATIATAIIDSINDDGYLTSPLEEIWTSLKQDLDVDLSEVKSVLQHVQTFDPPGVAARDLRECLLIQLQQYAPSTPWREQAMQIVREHLDLLGTHDYAQLMRRMKISQPELAQINGLIQKLNPRPGSPYSSNTSEYVIPDVFVRKKRGVWRVELNTEAMPRIRINSQYAGLIKRADNSIDNTYLRNHLQEARWFIKSLQSRHETLLRVASSIVERQRAFLDHGPEAMKPLVLHDIAEVVGMHESTISRVTTQKYMHTPQGIFELKYFFSSHVSTAEGGMCSATAIRALIKKLVAAENPQKPLSDSQIADLLAQQGINVARRTVAKYREALAIVPSSERKRLT